MYSLLLYNHEHLQEICKPQRKKCQSALGLNYVTDYD